MPTSSGIELVEEEKSKKKRKNKKRSDNVLPSAALDAIGSVDSHEALTLLKEIHDQNKKIKRRLTWMAVGSYLRLLIVLVPLILGIVYLPGLIDDFMTQYSSLLQNPDGIGSLFDVFGAMSNGEGPVDVNEAIGQIPADQLQAILENISR